MTLLQNTIKYASLLLVLTLTSCNQKYSEVHLQLEASQAQLETNLLMYETVWDKVINGRQIDLINLDSFDEGVTAVAASPDGDVVGLENFRFRKRVIPGDVLIMQMEFIVPIKRGVAKMKGEVYVGDELVCEGVLTAIVGKK